ncbi:MAG: hypothetical protein R2880_03695 [Deinococcales bacterium]
MPDIMSDSQANPHKHQNSDHQQNFTKTFRTLHWQHIYQQKSPSEVSWYQAKPQLSLDLIEKSITKDAAIIDVGSGASLLLDYLLTAGYHDLSALDIAASLSPQSKTLGWIRPKIFWYVTDVLNFQTLSPLTFGMIKRSFTFYKMKASKNAMLRS